MKKNGYEETTIMATDQRLKLLARNVNFDNPEEVKDFIDFIKTAQVSLDNLYY